jgi:hypothetical protein
MFVFVSWLPMATSELRRVSRQLLLLPTYLFSKGFGTIYPGLSTGVNDIKKCTGMTIVVSLEAFCGLLFGGMASAIMFAKVSRTQSFAQVTFCDPIVIRYGAGVLAQNSNEDPSDDEKSNEIEEMEGIPCPVLEFRILNCLNAIHGGEILDASVKIVASIDATQVASTGRNVTRHQRGKKSRRRSSARLHSRDQQRPKKPGRDALRSSLQAFFPTRPIHALGKSHQAFDEDPTGHLVPRRIFAKLEVESREHPFFKRNWTIRHVVDENSPLLKKDARMLLKQNKGFWPAELNSAEGVRAAIHFDQILVTMSGISNADAKSVYSQKIYDFVDVCVGYRFVNVLYRRADGSLRVDASLVSDVVEQAGGGAEPLQTQVAGESISQMLVL